jgi:hypothetical protein
VRAFLAFPVAVLAGVVAGAVIAASIYVAAFVAVAQYTYRSLK